MPLTPRCPNPSCGRSLRLPDSLDSESARCPACGHTFRTPRAEAATRTLPAEVASPPISSQVGAERATSVLASAWK